MAKRKNVGRNSSHFIRIELLPLEADLIAQAIDNYRDSQVSQDSPYTERLDTMVKLFNANSIDGEYEIL